MKAILFVSLALVLSACASTNTRDKSSQSGAQKLLIYAADEQCEKLIATPIASKTISAQTALDLAVQSVMPRLRETGMYVTGVELKQTGSKAELWFTTTTNTDRHVASMSSCERLSYVDALIATIKQRKEWGIESVDIFENGEPVEF
jgi:hypothetical protein